MSPSSLIGRDETWVIESVVSYEKAFLSVGEENAMLQLT
jgi:hypothetical protein